MKSDKELEELFDLAREEMSNSIGMKKEKLFVNIYGTDEEKKEYQKFVKTLTERHEKERNPKGRIVIYEKRPKE